MTHRSEARLAEIIASAMDAIVSTDEEQRIIVFNSAAEKLFGYRALDVIGKPLHLLIPERFRARHREDIRHFGATGEINRRMGQLGEIVGLCADGEEILLDVAISKAGASPHKIFTAFLRNVKESRRAELAMLPRELRIEGVITSMAEGIVSIDETLRIVLFNPAAEHMFGRSLKEMIGQPLSALIPERFRAQHDEHIRRFAATGQTNRAMGKYGLIYGLHASGEEFPIEATISQSGSSGNTLLTVILRDITERRRTEEGLLRFRMAMETSLEGIFLMDFETFRYLDVNETGCRMLGYSREELLTMRTMDTNLEISEADQRQRFEEARALGSDHVMTEREGRLMRRRDGSTFPIEVARRYMRIGEQEIVVGIARDITERKESETKISRLNRVYAVLSGINAAIVRIRDRRELFQEACRIIVEHGHFTLGWIAVLDHATGKLTAVAQAGLPENSGAGSAFFNGSVGLVPWGTAEVALREKRSAVDNVIVDAPELVDAGRESNTLAVRRAAIELGAKSVIVLPLVVEGATFGILTLYAPERDFFDDEEIKLLNELAGDIAFAIDHIDKQERLDYLAYYDVLTGLANRSLFLERVAQYIRSAASGGHKLALFQVDLERFKNINDSLGRPAGDALLQQVAEWLTRNAGDVNLLARVGADRFALVLPELKQEGDVARLLEKTMEGFLEHPFRLNDAVFRIAAKVGVALFPHDGADADTLFMNAEAALKQAKASGDRYLFYTQRMTALVAGKLTLENQLRQALDNEEFVLHYQPKVNLASGKLTGAEALIRWNDPRTGLVPPGQFIPILEETGLIYEVGRWALRKAIEDYLRWRAAGLSAVRIAVNVSPLQLRSRGFIAEIKQVIGIDAQAAAGLELEITESLIMEGIKHNIDSLQAIRAMGVSIAIDDFGTGFSSLSYLAKLPVDTLKIDRSFVIEMTAEQEGLALVSTIINLAHSLKLKVVAEGVETEEQSRLLGLLNCDEVQGYLFSKPVPSEIFETRYLAPPPTG